MNPGMKCVHCESAVQAAEEDQAGADEHQPEAEQDADRDHATGEPPGERRDEEGQHRQWQQAQAGLQRGVPEHVLELQRAGT